MTTPGFFELYPAARPAMPAGLYTATSHQDLEAAPPHGAEGTIPVDDTQFRVQIDSPRYAMPPEQILSTFPPAGSQGDWRERLPQIVLKRRTLPWERNPDPAVNPATAPPWLALVVLADGEGALSPDVDVTQCVTDDVNLGSDADVPKGKYLEVTEAVVKKVFPCKDELELLCHVRKVDLHDTELALGDDDGYLAVVLSSRLPQPAPPKQPGGELQPVKYTAYLINLEKQLPKLLPTEPNPVLSFDATLVYELVSAEYTLAAPEATLDQIAMGLGAGAKATPGMPAKKAVAKKTVAKKSAAAQAGGGSATSVGAVVPYGTGKGLEASASAWSTGPVAASPMAADDLSIVSAYKMGLGQGIPRFIEKRYRFPVLVSWEFTCTGSGGFERLMNDLDVGLLGTLDANQPPPVPEVAATGHVALEHRSRRGEPARSWFRGPLGPQPTQRTMPAGGVLPLAHTGDQLRKVVPDGREDISLAAMFEIGRLLTLSKPTLVAELMQWRRELFGAARARELAEMLAGMVFQDVGLGIAGGRDSLENLVLNSIVGSFTKLPPDALAPRAQEVTKSRVPDGLAGLGADVVLAGLGADPKVTRAATKQYGADGLGGVPLAVKEAPTVPVSQDQVALATLQTHLAQRVEQLTLDALKIDPIAAKGARRRGRRLDTLDQLITEAETAAEAETATPATDGED
jgi:hypothetical protein